jgi:hypothetical protein
MVPSVPGAVESPSGAIDKLNSLPIRMMRKRRVDPICA